jgi:hypothetical protein
MPPIYWHDSKLNMEVGPFLTLYDAMQNYSKSVENYKISEYNKKTLIQDAKADGKLIQVNFFTKKRI